MKRNIRTLIQFPISKRYFHTLTYSDIILNSLVTYSQPIASKNQSRPKNNRLRGLAR